MQERRKRLESCLAEDEETKFRSEAAKLRVDNWLASRVESTEKPRSGDAVSHEPSGAASSSAPAAAASGSVPMAVSSSSADERFRSDEVPDHGVKRVRWSPLEQDTKEFDPNEPSDASVQSRGLKRQPESTTEDLEDAGDQENRGDADDDDMKALGAVCEEPVITIGVDGETLDECENGEESYVDDVNGGFLDPEMVREARVEELAGYLKMQVYRRVPVAEIGSHRVIKTRWVDTNKGDERSPEIRCQLVAKEVKKRNITEEESANFFASTPPLEAVKFLISEVMTKSVSRNNRPLKLSFIDEKKAHLCSDVLRELYVEPPPEANEPPEIDWRLQRAMYGTRDAAAAWEREKTKTLNSVGFQSGVSNPALRYTARSWTHSRWYTRTIFITLGNDEALSEVERLISSRCAIKVRAVLGAGRDDAKEVRILNRYVRWNSDGGRNWIEYEPDPRHAELIVKTLNLESAKGVTTPSVKKSLEEVLTMFPQLNALQTRRYRSVVMRAAYLSQDRPDLSCSTKELARDMQKPTEQSMTNLKRLGRYLKKRPRLLQLFVEQASTANVVRLDVCGDSDHAGCLKTLKSTTGMVLMRDAHCLKVSSHTQSTISLSSGESEYYGIVKCAAIGLGARSMLSDFGICADVVGAH